MLAMNAFTVKIEHTITDKQIRDLLCTAFEGGSNYWYNIERREFGNTGLTYKDFSEGGKCQPPGDYYHWSQLIPLVQDCWLVLTAEDEPEKEYRLDRLAIQNGLRVMAEKHSEHFHDFLQENDDATTGDVFLQCCLFGKLIYS